MVKNLPANAGATGDVGLIPGLGRSRRGGNGNLLPYSCLENPMDTGAWWAMAHLDRILITFPMLYSGSFLYFLYSVIFLPGESQGRGSLVGCHLWGRTESDMTEAT